MKALRGPHVPIGVILAVLLLNLTTYRRTFEWKWPVERWTMYETKARLDPVAEFRRILVHTADGAVAPIDLGRAFGFLGKPYRLDRGIKRARAGFLRACLLALRKNEGAHIVGLTYERREWRYLEVSWQQHEASELPNRSYTVIGVEPPPAQLVAKVEGNLLQRPDFRKLGRSGKPRGWSVEGGAWLGVGMSFDTSAQSAMLARAPSAHALTQSVAVPQAAGTVTLHADVLARPDGPGAYLELVVTTAAGEVARVRTPANAPGTWQRIAVEHAVAAAPGLTAQVRLGTSGATRVFFDDAVLTADTASAPR